MAWGFHYDDVAPDVVQRDMDDYPVRGGVMPAWGSAGIPVTVALWSVTPGGAWPKRQPCGRRCWSPWAGRDVLVDPRGETRAYESSPSVDYFVCPRMATCTTSPGHAELFWQRIQAWGDWVRDWKATGEATP